MDGHVIESSGLSDSSVIHEPRATVERPSPPADPDGTTSDGVYCFVRLGFQSRIRSVQVTPAYLFNTSDPYGVGFATASLHDPSDFCSGPNGAPAGRGPTVAMYSLACADSNFDCPTAETRIIATDKAFFVTFFGD